MSVNIKGLLLFRHAKSAWPTGVDDHERPLSPRGRKAAPKMASFMQKEEILPQCAIVSTARRTQETWELLAPALPECKLRMEAGIYEASATDILRFIRSVDDAVDTLMVVGHNPGLEILAAQLTGSSEKDAEAAMRKKFPTAGLAVFSMEIDHWSELTDSTAHLERFITPKSLKKNGFSA